MVAHSLSLLKYRGWFSYLFILTEGKGVFIPQGIASLSFRQQLPLERNQRQKLPSNG